MSGLLSPQGWMTSHLDGPSGTNGDTRRSPLAGVIAVIFSAGTDAVSRPSPLRRKSGHGACHRGGCSRRQTTNRSTNTLLSLRAGDTTRRTVGRLVQLKRILHTPECAGRYQALQALSAQPAAVVGTGLSSAVTAVNASIVEIKRPRVAWNGDAAEARSLRDGGRVRRHPARP